jgi:hypothetical protein
MSTPVDQSPKITLGMIGVLAGLVLNLISVVGLAVAVGQWKGEVTAAIEQRAIEQREIKAEASRQDVELRVLTARIAQSDSVNGRTDERLKSMEQSLGEIKALIRNGVGK